MCIVSMHLTAQMNPEAELKSLHDAEAKRYQKLANFNVNPNTLNYDLRYQRLDLEVNPAVQFISGTVTSHFIPNENISSIYFDFADHFTVSEVKYHTANLNFSQLSTKEIKIDFPSELSSNSVDSLSISFSGIPTSANRGMYFTTSSDGPAAFTIAEPYGSREWFPTKQSLNDKIERIDLKITTPSQYSVGGNGKLMSESILSSGKKQTFWRTDYPIPAYLIALGIGNYVKNSETIGNPPFPYLNYLYPTTDASIGSKANIEWTKSVMEAFEEHFGPYPYRNEKYGHMEYTFYGSGMEHATMSSMGYFGQEIIAHELLHQWFGDKITCGKWNDIWLNEGFATFGQHFVNEKFILTHDQFLNYLLNQKNYITSLPNGSVYVADANLNSDAVIFDGRLSYSKAGYVVRMLKWILGEDAFYSAVRDYASRPNLAYSYAVTSDLQNSLLQSTGIDFSEFFNDWIYGEGYPIYAIQWNQVGSSLEFLVNQSQSHTTVSFFEMPLPIKANGTNGETAYFKLNNTTNNQFFTENINFTVASVEFNYEYQMLEKGSTVMHGSIMSTSDSGKNKLEIYPNPVTTELTILRLNKTESFEIFSIDGRKVKSGTSSKKVDVSGLGKGTYVIKVNNQNLKFIKN